MSPRKTGRLRGALACLFAGLALAPAEVRADGDSPAAAQALFDDAKALMKRGDYASACPKLEESEKLQPGGGTLLFLALCREGEGRTASAWAFFNEVVSVARQTGRVDREKVAQQHIVALTPKLMKLEVRVSPDAAATAGLTVRRDGQELARELWGTAVPVDPGEHVVSASAPSRADWHTSVTGTEGRTTPIVVPALAPVVAVGPDLPPTPPPVVSPSPAGAPRAPEPGDGGRTQRAIAVGIGAAGIVGIGVGTAFGILALSKKGDETAQCPGGASGPCNTTGVGLSRDAVADGNVSTIALSIGAAAVVGAAALWLFAPKAEASPGDPAKATKTAWRIAPAIGPNGGGFVLRGDLR